MIINHNMASLNTYRQMSTNTSNSTKSLEKLSSGLRINKAGDDAAGLAISEKMRAQVRGLDQASRNAQDGISMIQTAEGGLNEVHSILQRMRELADQSANGTNTADDRTSIQDEVKQLKDEIDRIGNTTEFNTQKLLNGNLKSAGSVGVGQNVTTSAVVGKLTEATLTATASMGAASIIDSDFTKETLNINGTTIDVNWQNLSTSEKDIIKSGTGAAANSTQENAAKDLILQKINEAIDAAGSNVSHVNGYVASNGNLNISSGLAGTDSKVGVTSATGLLAQVLGAAANASAVGTNTYNGTAVAGGANLNFSVNGVTMLATVTAGITAGAPMATAASTLQTEINAAIAKANQTAGATKVGDAGFIADVKVNATKDGRFEVVSETGPISFSDLKGGTVVKDLGLTQAQTDASSGGGMTFQIGANKGQTITFGVNDMRSAALGISGVDVSSQTGASNALTNLDTAIKSVSSERSKLGAVQNRLEHTINNLNTSSENLTAAESRIRDVDMAKEMMNFQKNNILSQAAQAMMAQANQQPQGVLQLLR